MVARAIYTRMSDLPDNDTDTWTYNMDVQHQQYRWSWRTINPKQGMIEPELYRAYTRVRALSASHNMYN